MNLPRKFLKFDYGVHILFGVVMLLMLIGFPYTVYLLIYALALLSAWQVLSALILGLIYRNRIRVYYLCSVAISIISTVLLEIFYQSILPMVLMALILSIWYGVLTYKDATYRTPSFWDLEF